MPRLYQSADIAVFPSLLEATSLGILEAMASGCPVIATSVGGNRELIVSGQSGLLVSPSKPEELWEAITRLRGMDGDGLETLRREAVKRVRDSYSWERIVGIVEESYRVALNSSISRAGKL
jgi:glycosyltransferase involved in cell wall biosynthesis